MARDKKLEMEKPGIIVVSNRLPLVIRSDGEGNVHVDPGNGGLVTALTPVLRQAKGTWVGWPGSIDSLTPSHEEAMAQAGQRMGLKLCPVFLTREDAKGYYRGFSSGVLWPLFHGLISNCRFEANYWDAYSRVNRNFARVVARSSNESDFIWIHDYHLLTTATELRLLKAENVLAFFLHVPFPPPEIFGHLPWRRQILEGLLDFDVVGFQTDNDAENFLRCTSEFVPDRQVGGLATSGETPHIVQTSRRGVTVGSFPISIDCREFRDLAESAEAKELAAKLHRHFDGQKVLLGVDRLDYTKGLPHKLRGFLLALERYRELRRRVTLVQYVVPSRESVPGYRELRPAIERLVGQINGQFGTCDWIPVRYFYQSLPREELCAYYRLADAMLVTSLKDGMNLVAKEYCAANVQGTGVLVLSEFAGAKNQLGRDALLVNPHDVDAVAEAIRTAVLMPSPERQRRMANLRRIVESNDVYHWVDSFLEATVDRPAPKMARTWRRSALTSLASK